MGTYKKKQTCETNLRHGRINPTSILIITVLKYLNKHVCMGILLKGHYTGHVVYSAEKHYLKAVT